jgi:hypothetical protein
VDSERSGEAEPGLLDRCMTRGRRRAPPALVTGRSLPSRGAGMSCVRPAVVLFSIFGLGLASPAIAKIDPWESSVPDLITLVARDANGGADPIGTFTVVVRDFNHFPDPGDNVILDFHNCPDILLCADQNDPNVFVDCTNRSIGAVSDSNGQATFRVVGCADSHGASAGSIGATLNVYANGMLLKVVRVAALDQAGCDGLSATDLSLWLQDYFSGRAFARSDYDGDGALNANDLSLWLSAFFAGKSALGCGSGTATCP